jgi:uncharacterized repeat protein (TIGR02543 family)
VNLTGGGSVAKTPNKSTFGYGEETKLTAAAAPGWTFVGWEGDLGGTENPKSITMNGDKSVRATFRILAYLPLIIRH